MDDYEDDDFGGYSEDEMDYSTNHSNVPSFETMTADEIVNLMNQYIEEVESIVEVRDFFFLRYFFVTVD